MATTTPAATKPEEAAEAAAQEAAAASLETQREPEPRTAMFKCQDCAMDKAVSEQYCPPCAQDCWMGERGAGEVVGVAVYKVLERILRTGIGVGSEGGSYWRGAPAQD